MQKARGLEYEVTGDGDAVLTIHGALIADTSFRFAAKRPWPTAID